MKSRYHVSSLLLAITFFAVLLCFPANVLAQIAKIASVKGDVIVNQSGQMTKITRPGLALNDGDQILTREGELQLAFNDGAILKINPHSKLSIQERMEQSGTWVFKSTQAARRVTCYVGKAWFKSGSSPVKNYLQTPTSVAGVRGSDGDFGYIPDRQLSLLNMYSGAADTVGTVVRGFFENPGRSAAQRSTIYQNTEKAYNLRVATEQTNARVGVTQAQRNLNNAEAVKVALNVVREGATILSQQNPDPSVKSQAQLTTAVVSTSISVVETQSAVSKVQIIRDEARLAAVQARATGNTQKAAACLEAVGYAEQVAVQLQKTAAGAIQQEVAAKRAAAAGNVAEVQKASQVTQPISTVSNATSQVTTATVTAIMNAADANKVVQDAQASGDTQRTAMGQQTARTAQAAAQATKETVTQIVRQLDAVQSAAVTGDVAKLQQEARVFQAAATTTTAAAQTVSAAINVEAMAVAATKAVQSATAGGNVAQIQQAQQALATATAAAVVTQQAVQMATQDTRNVTQSVETGNVSQAQQAANSSQQANQTSQQTQTQTQQATQNVITTTVPITTVPTTMITTSIAPTTAQTTTATTAQTTTATTTQSTTATTAATTTTTIPPPTTSSSTSSTTTSIPPPTSSTSSTTSEFTTSISHH